MLLHHQVGSDSPQWWSSPLFSSPTEADGVEGWGSAFVGGGYFKIWIWGIGDVYHLFERHLSSLSNFVALVSRLFCVFFYPLV